MSRRQWQRRRRKRGSRSAVQSWWWCWWWWWARRGVGGSGGKGWAPFPGEIGGIVVVAPQNVLAPSAATLPRWTTCSTQEEQFNSQKLVH